MAPKTPAWNDGGPTLHPVVQLRLGNPQAGTQSGKFFERRVSQPYYGKSLTNDDYAAPQAFIETVPPNHMLEFTNVSKRGVDEVSMSFIDHTFGRLEQDIFRCDREYGGKILYRWGYPGKGLEEGRWYHMQLLDYTPTISSAGLRITLSGLAVGSEFASYAQPTVYRGKISSVVKEIAKELGFDDSKVFVEESNDDIRDEEPKAEWPTGNMTRIDLIQQNFIPQVKSKKNPQGTYELVLISEGTFHFHTELYKRVKQELLGTEDPVKDQAYRRFNVLFGIPNGVLNFTPRYTSRAMGQIAAACIASAYDPRTKQFTQRVVDRNTLGMTTNHDPKGGGRTTAAPFADPNADPIEQRAKAESYSYFPVKQVALGGHCSGKAVHQHIGPDAALNRVESSWKRLHQIVLGGQLELVGLPELVDFVAMETYCEVAVFLPSGLQYADAPGLPNTNASLHWSSGRYLIHKITHSITSDYKISVELGKPTSLDGPETAKTGLPQEPSELSVGTSR